MGFREIIPKRRKSSSNSLNTVRVSFPKIKSSGKYNMNIYIGINIGINIAKKFDFKDGDKISFNVDEDNPKIWLLKKSANDVGYKLIGSKLSKNLTNLRLQMTWNEFIPSAEEIRTREVKFDIHGDGIMVFTYLTDAET